MSIKVNHNKVKTQFEVELEVEPAVLEYKVSSGKIYLIHTGVPKSNTQKGVAAALAIEALKYAKESDLETVIICPFIKTYVKRHPELLDGLNHSFYP